MRQIHENTWMSHLEDPVPGVFRSSWTHSSRMEHPPPVPVTHPKVQNLAQREGMRLAGWSGSLDVTSWSGFSIWALMLGDFLRPGGLVM